MEFLRKYKYTLIFLVVLTIGGILLNVNYYINKRPITQDMRVIVEEGELDFLDKTRVWELGKHTEEDVLLGFDPDFDWSNELSYTLDKKKTVTFDNIPNFGYGSVTTDVGPKEDGVNMTANFSIDASNADKQVRPVYYADIEVTEYVVDVYGVFGTYKYSFNDYVNNVVTDSVVLSIINEEDAEKQGLIQ